MLYSKCDIDFSAMGSKPEAENAIEFKGTLESAVHEVRMDLMLDQFFIVHEQCDFEEMALEAYVDAHGNEAILESNLTIIREAAEDKEKKTMIQKVKEYIAKIPGMISNALSSLSERLSGASIEKLKEKVKGIKNVKVEMPDFKSWADKIMNAFKSFNILEKILGKMKKGEKVTKEEINEEVAKATGGDPKGNTKAVLNIEQPKEKTQTVDGETFVEQIKKYAGMFATAIKEYGGKAKKLLEDFLKFIKDTTLLILWTYAMVIVTWIAVILVVIINFATAIIRAVTAIWNAGKKAAGNVADAAKTVGGAAYKAASAIKNTKKDDGNFSGETVEA